MKVDEDSDDPLLLLLVMFHSNGVPLLLLLSIKTGCMFMDEFRHGGSDGLISQFIITSDTGSWEMSNIEVAEKIISLFLEVDLLEISLYIMCSYNNSRKHTQLYNGI